MTTSIEVTGVKVAQDDEGRYRLNDLHKASGGAARHQPAFFFKRVEINELVSQINSSSGKNSAMSSRPGRFGGTFACKELVYAYAMWISPEFHLKVIRAYDDLAAPAPTPEPEFKVPQTMAQALRLAADQAEEIERQQALIEQAAPKVEFVDRYVESTSGDMTFRQVCKILGVKEKEFRAFLVAKGIMYQQGKTWLAYSQHIEQGRFSTKAGSADNGHAFTSTKFTAKGVEWIAKRWGGEKGLAIARESMQ